ncbi:hypothetical protein Pint_34155 [Pistacia integerrima]|uniref:Uncharacterized protein n=1 Tax=Pistacia integerrima TaxID=434235 RepID=A0ACC0X5N7_9ROSI|nr:hypothetical protein Pint_34155 [Pistacia integerrima]
MNLQKKKSLYRAELKNAKASHNITDLQNESVTIDTNPVTSHGF